MTAKKQSNKTSAKKTSTSGAVPFNKKNAQAFADMLYSDKGGVITCLKLCDNSLQIGKDGGRTIPCAVGEAYHVFINSSLKNVLNKVDATKFAIDALVDRALLKKNTEDNRERLRDALDDIVNTNDGSSTNCKTDGAEYAARSQQVAEAWRHEVLPLLK
jgi:hypothetical protein